MMRALTASARWIPATILASCLFAAPVAAATNRLLAADEALPHLTMIDADSNRIEGTMPVDGPVSLMVQSSKTGLVALSYRDRPAVGIRRVGSGEDIDTVRLDAPATRLLLSPDETTLAIICEDGRILFGRLAEPGTTHAVTGLSKVSDVAFGHSGEIALIAADGRAGLVVFDLQRFRQTGMIRDQGESLSGRKRLALSADHRRALELQGDGRRLVSYDLVHGRVEARIDLGEPARGLYLLGDYAALPLDGGKVVALRPVDALKEEVRVAVPAPVSGFVPVFGGSMGAFVSESGRRVFVVDTMTPRVVADVALPARPAGVSTGRGSLAVYVALPDADKVAVIGVVPHEVTMIETGSRRPAALAGTGDGQCR